MRPARAGRGRLCTMARTSMLEMTPPVDGPIVDLHRASVAARLAVTRGEGLGRRRRGVGLCVRGEGQHAEAGGEAEADEDAGESTLNTHGGLLFLRVQLLWSAHLPLQRSRTLLFRSLLGASVGAREEYALSV